MKNDRFRRSKAESKEAYFDFYRWLNINQNSKWDVFSIREELSKRHLGLTTYYSLKKINILNYDEYKELYSLNINEFHSNSLDDIFNKMKAYEKSYRKEKQSIYKQNRLRKLQGLKLQQLNTNPLESQMIINGIAELNYKLSAIMKYLNLK